MSILNEEQDEDEEKVLDQENTYPGKETTPAGRRNHRKWLALLEM
jgi:hypothetical protein